MNSLHTFNFSLVLLTFNFLLLTSPVFAIVDPLTVPNNKYGIHILTSSTREASEAARLINSSGGDWGYVTVLIESKNRDRQRWQTFFDELRRKHVIPLVRLATQPEGNWWKRPYEGEEQAWADFLGSLNWPIKNRYVIVYNEPNHAQEWGNFVDPEIYAITLDKTITALKNKSRDFFVLNGGFDASAPHQLPQYFDQLAFMRQMEEAAPGIFAKLDGWVSHSYPNPGFAGSPYDVGRGTVRGWLWELQVLRQLGVSQDLPVFITETGWKHAEGTDFDKSLPTSETVGDYLKQSFEGAWASDKVVAVTPFLLDYQEPPFDHFSFKKLTGEKQNAKILGAQYPDYYPQYQAVLDIPKVNGLPYQDNKAELVKGEVYSSLVSGEKYTIPLTFKNNGQSIWGERGPVGVRVTGKPQQPGGKDLFIPQAEIPADSRVEPGQQATFNLRFQAPQSGNYSFSLQLYNNNQPFDQTPFDFNSQVKAPVILKIKTNLKWKKTEAAEYILEVAGAVQDTASKILLGNDGSSKELEARYLLPDYKFNFTLSKPYYKPKAIGTTVRSGLNVLDFGELQPDFLSAIFKPNELWKLLPFSD